MEIQKIYSDPYDEERLYSVLMGEDEIRMFTGAVKRANKLKKKLWQMKEGEKALLNEGLKKYVSKGDKIVLNPAFSSEALLKEGRSPKKWKLMMYRDASIHDKINDKAYDYLYPRGKRTGKGSSDLDYKRRYSHPQHVLGDGGYPITEGYGWTCFGGSPIT